MKQYGRLLELTRRYRYILNVLALLLGMSMFRAGTHGHMAPVVWTARSAAISSGKAWNPDWPGWRGPHRDGVFDGDSGPAAWNRLDVKWKTRTAGRGHSSPIVTGTSVCITTSDQTSQ